MYNVLILIWCELAHGNQKKATQLFSCYYVVRNVTLYYVRNYIHPGQDIREKYRNISLQDILSSVWKLEDQNSLYNPLIIIIPLQNLQNEFQRRSLLSTIGRRNVC